MHFIEIRQKYFFLGRGGLMSARLDIWTATFTETGNRLFYKKSGQANNFLFTFDFKKHKIVETGGHLRFD